VSELVSERSTPRGLVSERSTPRGLVRERSTPRERDPVVSLLCALSGVVAGGLVVLTAVLVGAAMLGVPRGFPGPGGAAVAWHIGLTVVAVAAQIITDRHRGLAALAGATVVVAVAGYLLVTQWWN
jgi:hypothetical protein